LASPLPWKASVTVCPLYEASVDERSMVFCTQPVVLVAQVVCGVAMVLLPLLSWTASDSAQPLV